MKYQKYWLIKLVSNTKYQNITSLIELLSIIASWIIWVICFLYIHELLYSSTKQFNMVWFVAFLFCLKKGSSMTWSFFISFKLKFYIALKSSSFRMLLMVSIASITKRLLFPALIFLLCKVFKSLSVWE